MCVDRNEHTSWNRNSICTASRLVDTTNYREAGGVGARLFGFVAEGSAVDVVVTAIDEIEASRGFRFNTYLGSIRSLGKMQAKTPQSRNARNADQ